MPTIADEPRRSTIVQGLGQAWSVRVLFVCLLTSAGCNRAESDHARAKSEDQGKDKASSFEVIKPARRDIRMRVIQPGTVEAFESTPVYSHIAGYVKNYRFNIGDRVKADDVLLDMWIPDIDEQLNQKTAAQKRAEIQIRVAESMLKAAESRLETAEAKIDSAKAGVKRAQASYTRWDSEYKRLVTLVNNQVLDRQVRDETYRQFEEADAARDQATAMVAETTASRDTA
ncbi:efflux RND transporter periplasmic adaptor subunit, partial [Singulisphaera rosea]